MHMAAVGTYVWPAWPGVMMSCDVRVLRTRRWVCMLEIGMVLIVLIKTRVLYEVLFIQMARRFDVSLLCLGQIIIGLLVLFGV
jgi:hypothetical protein